ncbi:MAG: response regulator [Bdellovibrionales bacterium]
MSEEKKKSIVLVEDSPTNRTVIKHLLLKLDFKVIECENGRVAWEAMDAESEKEDIVAIISDIMMPEMDGIDLLEKTRSSEKWKDIPFVLVTAVMEKEQVLSAKKLGVDGYILKPVTFQRISAKLKEIFPEHKFPRVAA